VRIESVSKLFEIDEKTVGDGPSKAIYPIVIVAKAGGLQSQGAEGAAVVDLLQALGNHAVGVAGAGSGSGVLRLSR